MDVVSYYTDLTNHYIRYGGFSGWHHGLWGEGINNLSEALVHSSEKLAEGLDLTPDSRVLDVGCGVGSFATWCAAQHGCKVVGVTNCPSHIEIAERLARERGVSSHCRFVVMDMDMLGFAADTFDAVVNQETYCHSTDKRAYLEQVLRILRPGGVWSAIVFSLKDGVLSRQEREVYERVRQGFHIIEMLPAQKTTALLHDLGFTAVGDQDLTPLVKKTSQHILRRSWIPLLLVRLHLDWIFFRGGDAFRKNHQAHFLAGTEYSRGLLKGGFRHMLHRASKPEH